jgi:hypothetical protein
MAMNGQAVRFTSRWGHAEEDGPRTRDAMLDYRLTNGVVDEIPDMKWRSDGKRSELSSVEEGGMPCLRRSA